MKKLMFLGVLFFAVACNDGDLQIESINFDDSDIQFCESATNVDSRLFFKINDDEALILHLGSGLLKNEVSTTTITSSVTGASRLYYRLFSDAVTADYFCNIIPQSDPHVQEEIEASGGEILISSTLDADGITYRHLIQLNNITFERSNGSRITDLEISDFGEITTTE